MKLKDFVNFEIFEQDDKNIFQDITNGLLLKCDKDMNHKTIDCDAYLDFIEHNKPENFNLEIINKAEVLHLINQAQISFLNCVKLKNKYLPNSKYSSKFYLSKDKKYYCFYFGKNHKMNIWGLINKETGRYIIMGHISHYQFIYHYYYDIIDCEYIPFSNNLDYFRCLENIKQNPKIFDIFNYMNGYFDAAYDGIYDFNSEDYYSNK
ncbi:hypothetical protein ma109 [Moumouvirus australiensis]|uniref:Uncharacterized protein n=1 Tax=Moumouvirus australiensis TaxID=2109587 RepID=A0A2P1EKT7_9VIRU|nr:hypothetical protein QKC55_gp795 [Moumouvirus australiensis]AVL94495.1 hypothetical protein ma109 [Moumouvirus australiensis]